MTTILFTRLTREEFGGSGAAGHVSIGYPALVETLGEPWKNDPVGKNPEYPDDNYKTDVSWGLKHAEGGRLYVWNYKNGPAYNGGDGKVEDVDSFSFGFEGTPEQVSAAERDFFAVTGARRERY